MLFNKKVFSNGNLNDATFSLNANRVRTILFKTNFAKFVHTSTLKGNCAICFTSYLVLQQSENRFRYFDILDRRMESLYGVVESFLLYKIFYYKCSTRKLTDRVFYTFHKLSDTASRVPTKAFPLKSTNLPQYLHYLRGNLNSRLY